MEVERYKIILTSKINKKIEDKIKDEFSGFFIGKKLKDEIFSDNIRILGHNFVRNNTNKAKLIINNKKYILKEIINSKEFNYNKIKINIILSKDISNISYMFMNCSKLLEISIYDDIIDITNKKPYESEDSYNNIDYNEDIYDNILNNLCYDYIYPNYSAIAISTKEEESCYHSNNTEIKDINENIKIYQYNCYSNISNMFTNCLSLTSFPDIFKKNTNNIKNISNMFVNCSSLLSLPDISKWNTNNVTHMSFMFINCSSLLSLPDISKWNTNNVTDMSFMFVNCSSLSSLPDISKWNTNNVTDMAYMFNNCSSLLSLPDISKWNTNNLLI